MSGAKTRQDLSRIVWCFWALILPGCSKHDAAIRHGIATIPFAKEFNALFPGSDHFISYYTGDIGPPTWNSTAGLHGRYIVTMQVRVDIDRSAGSIVKYGDPLFFIHEVESISGRAIKYTGRQLEFGAKEWKKVVEAGGDFGAIGFKMVKDRPVPDFEESWRSG